MPAEVLVVDDDAVQRADLAEMVSSLGFAVQTAADGKEALEVLESGRIGIIVTDLMMPRMSGSELLQELASRGDRTPAIVLTGFGTIDQAVSIVRDLNAFWFMEKPVQPEVLRTLLERGWLGVFRAWVDVASRPRTDINAPEVFVPGQPTNLELSQAMAYLLDTREGVVA